MRILAIDHGTRSGFSYFVDNRYTYSGVILLKDIKELREAQKSFYELFQIYKPEVVVLEKINVAGTKFGGDNVIKLAQLQAIIIAIAQNYNCKIIYVNPTSMKKHITGNGRVEKREVAMHIAKKWNLNPDHICVPQYYKLKKGVKGYEADESDAIALGTYAMETMLNM